MNRSIICMGAVLAAAIPSAAVAGCGTGDCFVGALGQGGEASGGAAQGFYEKGAAPQFPGTTTTNSGSQRAGRIDVMGQGSVQGGINGNTFSGHGTGIFGDFSGQCDFSGSLPDICQ